MTTLEEATLLERAGCTLYGPEGWRVSLAVRLGVNPRTMARAARAERPIPPGWWPELRLLLLEHCNDASTLIEELPT